MNAQEPPTEATPSDLTASLLVSLRNGDPRAGAMLNDLYREPMIRFCWRYLGSVEDAEDAVQEVFCNVIATPQLPNRFRPWLYRIARNHCLNQLKRRSRRKDAQPLPSDSRLVEARTGYLSWCAKRELRSQIMHLYAALSSKYQEVLWLRYIEDFRRAEIAEILDLPESVVKSRLFEGVKKLREHSSLLEEK